MNQKKYFSDQLKNHVHTVAIVTGMVLLLGLPSYYIAGNIGMVGTLFSVVILILITSMLPVNRIMEMTKGVRLNRHQYKGLHQMIDELSLRAGLEKVPDLYYIPSRKANAFVVGGRRKCAIAVTQGILEMLNREELEGVLAHEISHIKNKDLLVMKIADIMTRLTWSMSNIGMILFFVSIPFLLIGETLMPISGIVILMVAPILNFLLQFALSRTREFVADLDAVQLVGSPYGLASALSKLDRGNQIIWNRFYRFANPLEELGLFRSHPPTQERIDRILNVALKQKVGRSDILYENVPPSHRQDLQGIYFPNLRARVFIFNIRS